MINAGSAKLKITPENSVWLDGMIRARKSEGVLDDIHVRTFLIGNTTNPKSLVCFISVEVCALRTADNFRFRTFIENTTGIPHENIILSTTHTHSAPAVYGFFNPNEPDYLNFLLEKVVESVQSALKAMQPASIQTAIGAETSISHYRRLLSDEGKVIMNWEPFPAERIVKTLGETDPTLSVLSAIQADEPHNIIGMLINHAGHPNILSGENYLISADYPGMACRLLEEQFGGAALFLNGAQGNIDIDGINDRDYEGVIRAGNALASAVSNAMSNPTYINDCKVTCMSYSYNLPGRVITPMELNWAKAILSDTKGNVAPLADGVGDDYTAQLYLNIHENGVETIPISCTSAAINDTAWISFSGELFTEIAQKIKRKSPFKHTNIIGLANGYEGYFPTDEAIEQGGYECATRRCNQSSEAIITDNSLRLLHALYKKHKEGV